MEKVKFEVGKMYGYLADYMDMAGSYPIYFLCVGRSAKFVSFQRVNSSGRMFGEPYKVKVREFDSSQELVEPKDCWFFLGAKSVVQGVA